ncbi:MAG TPA: biotin/lipoyl-binding protein [Streptosporangiaceae bacterium]
MNGTLGVLLVGGAGYAYFSIADDGTSASAATQTAAVGRGTLLSSVSASGSVESAKTEEVNFGTSGTVEKINVESGDKVKKGQVLAELDDIEAKENLDAAKAALDAADDNTSTASGYSSYVSAKNSYNDAQRALDGTVLKAPFSGTVTAVNGTVGGSSGGSASSSSSSSSSSSGNGSASGSGGAGGGGSAGGGSASGSSGSSGSSSSSGSSGSGFIELADVGKLQVKGEFTEADTTKLKIGQQATVSFAALSGVTAAGKVMSIDVAPTTNNNVVQYGATVSLTSRPAGVRIGQTATVQVIVSKADNVLYVPTAAVRTAGGQSTVTVMRNGKQVVKTVQVGIQGDQGTEIKSGLNPGDRVVLSTSSTGTGNGFPAGGFPGGLGGGRGGRR